VELAKRRQPSGLQLWTFQVNGTARRFYERHGFLAVESTDGSGNEEGDPDVRYVWRPDER
jgi:membrane-anchored protein YejM (alkaline phosphatase superfamily)